MSEWPEEPDLSGWESLRGPVAWAYNILREGQPMSDNLRTRIAAVLRLHQWRATVRTSDDDPVLDCTCGMAFGPHREAHGNTFDCYRDHVADAVIRELERMKSTRRGRSVAMSELDGVLVDFGLWLSEELRGEPMSRIDLESCLQDWKEGW